jgi:hypothetical protein
LRAHQTIASADALTRRLGSYAVLVALFLAAGCSSDSDPTPPGPGTDQAPLGLGSDPAPDFSLRDVNANSPRFDEMVSPRDYEGQVSAYYFGYAT